MMKRTDFDRITAYTQAMVTARTLYNKGLLKQSEFTHFERRMMQKYSIPENSIYRIKRLDNFKA